MSIRTAVEEYIKKDSVQKILKQSQLVVQEAQKQKGSFDLFWIVAGPIVRLALVYCTYVFYRMGMSSGIVGVGVTMCVGFPGFLYSMSRMTQQSHVDGMSPISLYCNHLMKEVLGGGRYLHGPGLCERSIRINVNHCLGGEYSFSDHDSFLIQIPGYDISGCVPSRSNILSGHQDQVSGVNIITLTIRNMQYVSTSPIYILSNGSAKKISMGQHIPLEMGQFEGRYNVYSYDPIHTRMILTPQMMDVLGSYDKQNNTIYMILENKIIAIQENKHIVTKTLPGGSYIDQVCETSVDFLRDIIAIYKFTKAIQPEYLIKV